MLNKMMLFPLGFMFLLSVYAVMHTGATFEGTTGNYSSQEIEIGGEPGDIYIEEAGSYSFDIWDIGGAYIILAAAISVGILAGVKVLGSGLSTMSQSLIFNGILFIGLWACLSIVASDFFFSGTIFLIIWVCLTSIYTIGMGIHMTNPGVSG